MAGFKCLYKTSKAFSGRLEEERYLELKVGIITAVVSARGSVLGRGSDTIDVGGRWRVAAGYPADS